MTSGELHEYLHSLNDEQLAILQELCGMILQARNKQYIEQLKREAVADRNATRSKFTNEGGANAPFTTADMAFLSRLKVRL